MNSLDGSAVFGEHAIAELGSPVVEDAVDRVVGNVREEALEGLFIDVAPPLSSGSRFLGIGECDEEGDEEC